MRIALITWRDAVVEAADDDRPATAQHVELTEIGFLLDENPDAILLSMERVGADVQPGRWRLHIPRRNIVRMHVVEVGKAFPKKTLVWES